MCYMCYLSSFCSSALDRLRHRCEGRNRCSVDMAHNNLRHPEETLECRYLSGGGFQLKVYYRCEVSIK